MSRISRQGRRRGQRKSPFRHPVKPHVRAGIQVGGYIRGKGRQPRQPKRTRRTGGRVRGLKPFKTRFTDFHVSIRFARGSSESLPVDAKNFATALTKGLTKRERADPPRSVLVRRVQ